MQVCGVPAKGAGVISYRKILTTLVAVVALLVSSAGVCTGAAFGQSVANLGAAATMQPSELGLRSAAVSVKRSDDTEAPSAPNVADFQINIEDLQPRVLKDENKIVISGTVTSRSRNLSPVQLDVFVQTRPEVTLEGLRSYLAGDASPGRWVAQQKISSVSAGQTQAFSIVINRSDLPLYSDWEWGPRGISVQASSAEWDSTDRSVFVWDSGYPVAQTKVGAIVPFTEDVVLRNGEVTLASPSASKTETFVHLARTPGVIPAAPPTLLGENDPLAKVASEFASPVVLLPVADADTATIAHLPQSANVAALVRESKAAYKVDTPAGVNVVDDWILPVLPRLDKDTIAAWHDQVIVAPTDILPVEELTYRPSAWSRFNYETGAATTYEDGAGVNVLVPDTQISKLLDAPSVSAAQELDIQQLLVATTAIITRQLPNEGRTVLALAKRPEGDFPAHAQRRYEALLKQRWVAPLTATDLDFKKSPPLTERATLDADSHTASGVTVEELQRLQRAVESTAAMSSAVADSSDLAEDLRQRVLTVTAVGLRLQPQLRQTLIAGVVKETRQFSQAVKVAQSAPINLLDSTANLPVRVSNDLHEDVSVVVALKPSDPRLQIVEDVAVDVPAKSGVLAAIPVKAVASGNVTIRVVVKGPNGLVIDDNTTLTVRVRAEWETTGVAILGAALLLLLLVGIVRTVRKGRKMERLEDGSEC